MSTHYVVTMHPRHHASLVAGTKRTTVRWGEDVVPGPTTFVFEPPEYEPLDGEVVTVTEHPASHLTADAAHAAPGTDMRRFVAELRANYYPEMPDDAVLQVVTFTLES